MLGRALHCGGVGFDSQWRTENRQHRVLQQIGERADRFRQGFVSRVVQIPDGGFVRTAPVLSHASGEAPNYFGKRKRACDGLQGGKKWEA